MTTRTQAPVAGPSSAVHQAAERHLVERAARGDLRTWELVVRRHQEAMFRLALLMLAEDDPATEATRQAFVRAYRALPGLLPEAAFRPWLIGVVATTTRGQRRELATMWDRNTRPPERMPTPRLAATPLPASVHARAMPPELQDALASSFERLGWDDRLTIAARYLLGLSREEAAILMAIEPAAVDASLRAAIQRLRVRSEDPRLLAISADGIGPLAIANALSRSRSIPDVAPSVTDRLVRDAIAYPEHFARTGRSELPAAVPPSAPGGPGRSGLRPVKRTRGRIHWIGTMVSGFAIVAVVGASALVIMPAAIEPAHMGAPGDSGWGTVASTNESGTSAGVEGTMPVLERPDDPVSLAIRPAVASDAVIGRRAARVPVTLMSPVGPIERRDADGSWVTVAQSFVPEPPIVRVPTGREQAFRIAPTAGAEVSAGTETNVAVRLRDSERVRASDGKRRRQRDAIGGTVLSIEPGASARATFEGQGVALVGPMHGNAGTLLVSIDDEIVVTRDLAADERTPRRVVLSEVLEPGRHRVEIRALDGRFDLDAILIVS